MEAVSKNDERNGWKPQIEQTNAQDDEGRRNGYGSVFIWHVTMGDNLRLYHNPRCSKSRRQAVALLQEAGFEFEEYRYLSNGVHVGDIELISSIPNIIRKKDVVGDVDVNNINPNSIKELLREQPKCMERPVLVYNNQAVLGRPPEAILEFLQKNQ